MRWLNDYGSTYWVKAYFRLADTPGSGAIWINGYATECGLSNSKCETWENLLPRTAEARASSEVAAQVARILVAGGATAECSCIRCWTSDGPMVWVSLDSASLNFRTAGCGPACPVVWQGGRKLSPYADCGTTRIYPAFLTRGLLISVTVVDKPKVRSFDSGVAKVDNPFLVDKLDGSQSTSFQLYSADPRLP